MLELVFIIPAIFWLIVSALFNVLGEYFSKLWANSPSWYMLGLIILSYAISSVIWLPALLQQNKISTTGSVWVIISFTFTVLLGLFVFKEHLSISQWWGIGLAAIAVFLLIK